MNKKGQSAIESPAATARRLRGQSAMEYLMTYGWAILVIIIVIAVLFYIGVLNPRNVTPTSCAFPPGISCASFKLAEDNTLTLRIGQAVGHRITVTNASCLQAGASDPGIDTNWTMFLPTHEIGSGEQDTSDISLTCEDSTGGAIPAGIIGETVKLKVWLNYTEADTGTTRQVIGDVSARYEPS